MTKKSGRSGHSTTYLEVTTRSQDVSKNRSKIRVHAWTKSDSSGWSGWNYDGVGWSVTVAGPGANKSGSKSFSPTTSITWFDYETWVPHDSDGTLSVKVSMSIGETSTSSFGNPPNLSLTHKLKTIPRASVLTGPSSVNISDTFKLKLKKYASSFTHDIYIMYGSKRYGIMSGLMDYIDPSWNYQIPPGVLASIPNSRSGKYKFVCDTYRSGTDYVNRKKLGTTSFTITVKADQSVAPSVVTPTPPYGSGPAWDLTERFYAGHSVVQGWPEANVAQYGATIQKEAVYLDGRAITTWNPTTGFSPLVKPNLSSGAHTLTVTATDSRGLTAKKSGTFNVLPYHAPTVSGQLFRRATSSGALSNDGTTARVDAKTTVSSLKNTSGTEKNTAQWKLQSRPPGGNWTTIGTWNGTVPTWSTHKYGSTIPLTESRDMRLIVTDQLSSTTVAGSISTAKVALALGKGGIGAGKFHEHGALDVGGDAYFNGRLITPPGGHILWSGSPVYMKRTQTVTLSENISDQLTGIVLHWQAYNGSVQNYNHGYEFIPKSHIAADPGGGVRWPAAGHGGTGDVYKYVYVSDNKLTGHDDNSASPANSIVLTEVIGV